MIYFLKFFRKFSRTLSLIAYIIFLIIGSISIVFIFARFCTGKTLLKNFRNLFVIRHFLYVVTYCIILGPYKLYILLKMLNFNQDQIPINFNLCLYCNVSIGLLMFFIRSFETNFYNKLCCYFCKNRKNNYFIDIPLTSIISRNMNLEFMCCILYGLSDIFAKDDRRKRKRSSIFDAEDDCTLNIVDGDKTNNKSDFNFEKAYSKDRSLLPNELRK